MVYAALLVYSPTKLSLSFSAICRCCSPRWARESVCVFSVDRAFSLIPYCLRATRTTYSVPHITSVAFKFSRKCSLMHSCTDTPIRRRKVILFPYYLSPLSIQMCVCLFSQHPIRAKDSKKNERSVECNGKSNISFMESRTIFGELPQGQPFAAQFSNTQCITVVWSLD